MALAFNISNFNFYSVRRVACGLFVGDCSSISSGFLGLLLSAKISSKSWEFGESCSVSGRLCYTDYVILIETIHNEAIHNETSQIEAILIMLY